MNGFCNTWAQSAFRQNSHQIKWESLLQLWFWKCLHMCWTSGLSNPIEVHRTTCLKLIPYKFVGSKPKEEVQNWALHEQWLRVSKKNCLRKLILRLQCLTLLLYFENLFVCRRPGKKEKRYPHSLNWRQHSCIIWIVLIQIKLCTLSNGINI